MFNKKTGEHTHRAAKIAENQRRERITMSFVGGGVVGGTDVHKFVEALQADFKTLSLETKKKYPQIKEVSTYARVMTTLRLLLLQFPPESR